MNFESVLNEEKTQKSFTPLFILQSSLIIYEAILKMDFR